MAALGIPGGHTGCVRIARSADAGLIASIYAPYVTDTVISFEAEPPSEIQMRDRIETILRRLPWLVFEQAGVILGYAYASPHAERAGYLWSVDMAVYVAQGAHRRGVGRSLYDRLVNVLRLQEYQNAFAGITLPNQASVGLHEAVGFTPIGVYTSVGFKLGGWHDVGWWGMALGPAPTQPRHPRLFTAELFEHAAWHSPA
jgi:L-amino acid N-acyltransferase YncA